MGGFYECIISIIKSSLQKTLGKAKISYVEMCTFISEVEGNMHNRPLTHLNEENVNKLLRPNRLIYGRSLTSVNGTDLVEINGNEIRKLKIFTTNLLKQFMGKFKIPFMGKFMGEFMGKFKHEYLLALQQRHSYDRKVKSSDCYLKIGDVVMVKRRNITTIIFEKGTCHRATLWPQ